LGNYEDKNRFGLEKGNSLDVRIDIITKSLPRQYYKNTLKKLADQNFHNAETLCNYIIAEQNEMNIKNTTKETKIKILVWLSDFHSAKNYEQMTKEDILAFLNKLRKSQDQDPIHKWIGSYNGRYIVLSKFFRWLFSPQQSDSRKRLTPPCMQGIRRLPRKEKTPYEAPDIWDNKDHRIFLKYCPNKRDRCYHAMAIDLSARPHEILNLKVKDIKFYKNENNRQYAEVRIRDGKTGPRTIPLIEGIPYYKEWLAEHPMSTNPESWLFIPTSNNTNTKGLSYDGLAYKYEYYKKKFFPSLLNDPEIPELDKVLIRNLLTKPWNIYIFRHSALTEKSQYLTEANLRDHAGWSMSSKMPQIYIHLNGESNKALLRRKGILVNNKEDQYNQIKSITCPNCFELNKIDNRFCMQCKMVLSYDSYNEAKNEDKQEITNLRNEMQDLRSEFKKLIKMIQQNPLLANVKPEVLKTI
jgi:integrase